MILVNIKINFFIFITLGYKLKLNCEFYDYLLSLKIKNKNNFDYLFFKTLNKYYIIRFIIIK